MDDDLGLRDMSLDPAETVVQVGEKGRVISRSRVHVPHHGNLVLKQSVKKTLLRNRNRFRNRNFLQ
jgi:hypothetical protein